MAEEWRHKPRKTKAKARLLEWLRGNQPGRMADAAAEFGVLVSAVSATMRKLHDEGLVWSPKRGEWALDDWEPGQERAQDSEAAAADNVIELPARVPDKVAGDLQRALSEVTIWCGAYDGPDSDKMAVEVFLAREHLRRAFEFKAKRSVNA